MCRPLDRVSLVSFCSSCGLALKNKKMYSEMVKNRPESTKCALSMALLGVGLATLVGYNLMKYLFLFLIEETYGCFKE